MTEVNKHVFLLQKLDFLCGGDTAAGHSQLTYDQISSKLLEFFSMKTSFDDIVNWITVRSSVYFMTCAYSFFLIG